MNLCDFCEKIVEKIVNHSKRSGQFEIESWDRQKTTGFSESATRCNLCKMIAKYIEEDYYHNEFLLSNPIKNPYNFTCNIYRSHRKGDKICPCWCSIFLKQARKRSVVSFAIWADAGTPASKRLVTRPPILVDGTSNMFQLVRGLLYDCITHHHCNHSQASGNIVHDHTPDLPTRILEVDGDFNVPSVRLIETQGRKGRYCALSHCWGSTSSHSLFTTTRKNIGTHLLGISLEKLPSTFRDAVILTRNLGIKYLWIDSLCIIQDDDDDWKRESAVMGLLYQNTSLVIAAAGSKDSAGGLFITKRPKPLTTQLPFLVDGNQQGVFNATVSPNDKIIPNEGILRKRAWAFQEWCLARRIVFFMPGGITWRCAKQKLDEFGTHRELGLFEDVSWFNLLQEYTGKELTRESDRLIAVQGIANEMRNIRDDTFTFGLWKKEIVDHLIWEVVEIEEHKNVPSLPSWCWASLGGRKNFHATFWHGEGVSESREGIVMDMPTSMNLSDTGLLRIVQGNMIRPHFAADGIRRCCQASFTGNLKALTTEEHYNRRAEFNNYENIMLSSGLFLFDASDHRTVLGIGMFDKDRVSNAVCFFLCTARRLGDDPLSPNFQGPKPSTAPTILAHDKMMRFNPAKCVDLIEFARCDFVFWALLLEQIGEAKYKRVGLAMLYPRALELDSAQKLDFEIV